MKGIIVLLCFVLLFFGCKNDQVVNLSTLEKSKIDILLIKGNDFKLPKGERIKNTTEAFALLKERNDSISIDYLLQVSDRYYNVEQYEDFKKVSLLVYNKSLKKKDSLSLAKALKNIGDYYFFNLKSDSAYANYTKAEKIYKLIGKEDTDLRIAYNKASILLYEKNFMQCEVDIINVLKKANLKKDNRLIYDCYLTLGMASRGMKNYSTAIDYYNRALQQAEKLIADPQYVLLQAQPLNYIALALQKQNKFSEALLYSRKALSLDNFKKNDPILFCYFVGTYAYSKFKLGDRKSQSIFYENLKTSNFLKNLNIELTSKLYLSECYLMQQDNATAKKLALDVLKIAKANTIFEDELKALELLAKIDPQNSDTYNQRYITLNDSLQDVERATRNKFARIEFETEEISTEKKIVEAEKARISTQRWLILGLSLLVILALALLYIVKTQRARNKELRYIQQQQKTNEDIYQLMLSQQQKIEEGKQIEKHRISRELHDGIMGKLTAIRLNLFVLQKRNDPETLARCVEHVNEIQNIEKEIRKIAHDLHQNVFADHSDFTLMINNLVANIKEHSFINFKTIIDEKIDWKNINNVVKMQVYRILQEALQNIEKYAQAKSVVIRMEQKEAKIKISVADDGLGFDATIKGGIGHKNMNERAAEIGGVLKIASEKGKGTRITLKIPT